MNNQEYPYMNVPSCNWNLNDDGYVQYWDTQCEDTFIIHNGTPSDNKMAYCCFCGRPLIEKTLRPRV